VSRANEKRRAEPSYTTKTNNADREGRQKTEQIERGGVKKEKKKSDGKKTQKQFRGIKVLVKVIKVEKEHARGCPGKTRLGTKGAHEK